MKKYMWLLVLVLGMSTTAWGVCRVGIDVEEPVCAGDTSLAFSGSICCSGQCTIDEDPVVSQFGRTIYMDIYLNCTCPCGYTEEGDDDTLELAYPLCPGLYIVVVRVWCTYEFWPYCMFNRPILCGMGSTWFNVCCCGAPPS